MEARRAVAAAALHDATIGPEPPSEPHRAPGRHCCTGAMIPRSAGRRTGWAVGAGFEARPRPRHPANRPRPNGFTTSVPQPGEVACVRRAETECPVARDPGDLSLGHAHGSPPSPGGCPRHRQAARQRLLPMTGNGPPATVYRGTRRLAESAAVRRARVRREPRPPTAPARPQEELGVRSSARGIGIRSSVVAPAPPLPAICPPDPATSARSDARYRPLPDTPPHRVRRGCPVVVVLEDGLAPAAALVTCRGHGAGGTGRHRGRCRDVVRQRACGTRSRPAARWRRA